MKKRIFKLNYVVFSTFVLLVISCNKEDDNVFNQGVVNSSKKVSSKSMISTASVPSSGLVAEYKFSGNGNDTSGNGNNASVVSATLTTDRYSANNSCYQFNGISNYIEIPDSNVLSINTTNKLSISVWLRPDVLNFSHSQSGYVHWMGKGVSNQHEYVFRMYNLSDATRPNRMSAYAFNLSGGLGAGGYVQETVTTGVWIHLVAVYDYTNNQIKLYKNGVLKDTDTFSGYSIVPANGTAPFRIGTRDFGSYFEGAIDDVRVYDRALSVSEINSLYNE